MWKALEEFVVPQEIKKLSKKREADSKNVVKIQIWTSKLFKIRSGLRPDDLFFPTLFNFDIEKVLRATGFKKKWIDTTHFRTATNICRKMRSY